MSLEALLGIVQPGWFLIGLGLVLSLFPKSFRNPMMLFGSGITFGQLLLFPVPATPSFGLMLGFVFTLHFVMGLIYGWRILSLLNQQAGLIYAGASILATQATDLFTLCVAIEIMAIGSTLLVFGGNMLEATKAGFRYAMMHGLSGAMFLAGAAMLASTTGSGAIPESVIITTIHDLIRADRVAYGLLLCSIAINLAFPVFGFWLVDSYPKASHVGGVWLSAFTTKTNILLCMVFFTGSPILIPIGTILIGYGLLYGFLEQDIKRIFSYLLIVGLGMMVVAIGVGTKLALYGVMLMAVSHILYKSVLFMVAGVIETTTGSRKLKDLGGLYRSLPLPCCVACIAIFSMIAMPGTFGYVAKALVIEALHHPKAHALWTFMIGANAGIVLIACRFLWFTFFHKRDGGNASLNKRRDSLQYLAMMMLTVSMVVLGVMPNVSYALLPSLTFIHPYSLTHVIEQSQVIIMATVTWYILHPYLMPKNVRLRDGDWLWSVVCMDVISVINLGYDAGKKAVVSCLNKWKIKAIHGLFALSGPTGSLAGNWSISITLAWIALMMILTLAMAYYIKL